MLHGKKGLCIDDVTKLKLIRHFHEDLGLELETVDFILSYRSQIQKMKRRLEDMHQRLQRQEQDHRMQMLALRRQLAQASGKE